MINNVNNLFKKKNIDEIEIIKQQEKEEFEELNILAEQGDKEAQYYLGLYYTSGYGIEENYNEGVKWYEKAAKQGHKKAQYILGECYDYGYGLEQNIEEALKWYKEVAKIGQADAQNKLGDSYISEENYKEAKLWYLKALNQGNIEACYNLGNMYENGYGLEQDMTKAIMCYKKVIEKGHNEIQDYLDNKESIKTQTNYFSNKIERDLDYLLEKYLKLVKQEDIKMQYDLGMSYENGYGLKRNIEKAVKWYKKAAEGGNVKAQDKLGDYYYNCGSKGYKEAVKWWKKAAEQGYAEAQNKLGLCYYNNIGVNEEEDRIIKWYIKVIEQMMKWYIKLVERENIEVRNKVDYYNYKEAVKWWKKAAEQGHKDAQYNLGSYYAHNLSIVNNKKEAVKWWKKAAEQDYAEAQYKLGFCYYKGKGIKINKDEAVRWWKKAAEQGHKEAQDILLKEERK